MRQQPAPAKPMGAADAAVLRDLLDAMAEGVVETTPDGRLVVVNRAFAEMLGYDSPEQLLESVPDVTVLYARPAERASAVAQVESEGRTVLDVELVRRDGSTMWARVRAVSHRDPSGAVTSRSAVIEDATAIRDAERRLEVERDRTRLAFDRNPVPLAILGLRDDGQYGLVSVNQAAEDLFGYPPGQLLETSPSDLMDPHSVEREVQLLSGLLSESAGAAVEIETRRRRADGTVFPVRIWATTFHAADGRSYTVSALEDLTMRRAAVDAIGALARQRYELLHELVRVETEERERIAYDVHDHLIQLLLSASLRLQVVLEQTPNEGVAEALEAVTTATARLRGLLRDLEPVVDAAALPSALADTGRALFDGTGVRVEVEGFLDDLPPSATAALLNCAREALTNARRHARCRVVKVQLASYSRWHEVVVHDDGVGLREGSQDESRHRGLRGMRIRAEAIGGTVRVEGAAGGGTRVQIRVPRTPVQDHAGGPPVAEPFIRPVQPST